MITPILENISATAPFLEIAFVRLLELKGTFDETKMITCCVKGCC